MPWERVVEKSGGTIGQSWNNHINDSAIGQRANNLAKGGNGYKVVAKGWQPQCKCSAPTEQGIVLDMFMGSGTVAKVATRHSRSWMGCELNPDYIEIAERRLGKGVPAGVQVDLFSSSGVLVM
jgi:hypothetical protein